MGDDAGAVLGRRRGCGRGYVTIARGLHRLRLPDDADDCARLRADALAFQLVLPVEAVAARRRRGAPLLRQALALADGRSDSPYETLLRLLHVSCGIEVVPQYELLDEAGNFVAKGDLLLAGTTTFHEYDGADHLKRPQQRKDRKRDRRIGNSGAVRRGYTKEDVLTQGITILRDADLSLGRVHDPSRIRPWHDLLRASLFTPAGTAVLCRRLQILGPDGQIRGGGPSA